VGAKLDERPGELELARRAASAEPAALREIHRQHARTLHALAYRLTGCAADADDVIQDLFVGLPEALRRFDGRGALRGWLRTVTSRLALQRLRRERRRGEASLERAPERGVAPPDTEAQATLRAAIDALPEPLRLVFVMRAIEGYSHAEIAELLGIRPNTAEVRMHRARQLLRRQLGEEL
jgi:RNA polymerase sigma-70 factor, ECF subfamily